MQLPQRFQDLPEYAFPRLRALLDVHSPGAEPIAMSLGEPKHAAPPFLGQALDDAAALWSRYPANEGLPELRGAISDWIGRRFGVEEARRDPDAHIFPLNGTREGLFNACLALCPEQKNGKRPAVILPNPFYQCYVAATLTVGAEPIFTACGPESGFLPDLDALTPEILDRTAIFYLCSPANPQGAVATEGYWRKLIALAEQHDFTVFADECYSEIWRDAAPTSALRVAQDMGADPERVVIFHSLSKRSNLPGLRSGFAAGGPRAIASMKRLRAYSGAPIPGPIQAASAQVWADEAHVDASRALYQRKYAIADEILGGAPYYTAPEAGFFLWLQTGTTAEDGEATALKLWREAGVRALPGHYLSRPVTPGLGAGDPGAGFLRVALVASVEDVREGLTRIRNCLEG
ncbi:aminotransferase class I/II-fold pyridoxal phosphate-dependent enzyme [Rhodovulum sp. DZ06]|uniref:aminotransferase class I/II-fold pyridoxal phosphate-dependent enzyme n=1 Tax=Rhodovulum sp. DZ06 TaxID=3425126 RepID=UPI003D3570F5